jgi:hypothetical protein
MVNQKNESRVKGVSPTFSVPPSFTGKGARGLGSYSLSSLAKLGIRTLTRRIEDDASTSPCQGEAIKEKKTKETN